MIPDPQRGDVWRAANGIQRDIYDVHTELVACLGDVVIVHYVIYGSSKNRGGHCTLQTWKKWVLRNKAVKVT